jgi:hypothetical protein
MWRVEQRWRAGRQRRSEIAVAATELSRVRDASTQALFKWPLRLTGGHREQLSVLAQLQIPKGLQVTNSGTKIKIEISSNFKGVQPFLKKSDKFYKILSSQA